MKFRSITLTLGLTLAVAPMACSERQADANTNTPDEKSAESKDDGVENLCTKYDSCDACIAGKQAAGADEGTAETQCALAVTGCWTTWDKPITCGAQSFDEQPAS